MTYQIRGIRSFKAAHASLWKGTVQFLQRVPFLALLALSLLLLVAQQGFARVSTGTIGCNESEVKPIDVYRSDIAQAHLSAALNTRNFSWDKTVLGHGLPGDPAWYGDVEDNAGSRCGNPPDMLDDLNGTGQFRAKHEIFISPEAGFVANSGIDLLDESLSFPVVIDPGGFILDLAKAPGLVFNLPAGPPGGSHSAALEARPDVTVAEVILR